MGRQRQQIEERGHRLGLVLAMLRESGVSQHDIGVRTGVGSQYVSDVKNGRRALTELFARRLADEFGVDSRWLLTGIGVPPMSTLDQVAGTRRGRSPTVVLPVLPELVDGNPRAAACWDGTMVELGIPAAVAAVERAVDPYVLQLGHGDRDGRLRVRDLILISQAAEPEASLAVVRGDGFLRLVRCSRSGRWRDVENGDPLADNPEVIGRGIAIVWGSL